MLTEKRRNLLTLYVSFFKLKCGRNTHMRNYAAYEEGTANDRTCQKWFTLKIRLNILHDQID